MVQATLGGAVGKGSRGVSKFALVASASTTSIASSVKKRKKERRFSFDRKRTRDIRGDILYLRDPRQILPICFHEPCPYIHDTTTSSSVGKTMGNLGWGKLNAKTPKGLARAFPATSRAACQAANAKKRERFPERSPERVRQGDQIPILIS